MISINPEGSGRLSVAFPYHPGIVAKIKTIKGRRWHPDKKFWSFPYSEPVLQEILSVLAGEDIQLNPSLLSLLAQTEEEKPAADEIPSASSATDQLLDRVRDLIRLKHYSIRTEKSYPWIQKYISFHHGRDPSEMGSTEIEQFLSHLAVAAKVSASTQNQAFNALIFLYRNVLKKELDQSIDAIRAKRGGATAHGYD
jgi:hypothetical protein